MRFVGDSILSIMGREEKNTQSDLQTLQSFCFRVKEGIMF